MFGALSSCVLVLLVSGVAQIPKQPDFSGEWELVNTSGKASDPATALTVRQTITRTTMRGESMTPWFSDLTVERRFTTRVVSESYKIGIISGRVGGILPGASSPGEWTTVAVTWEGESLIIRTGRYSGPAQHTDPDTEHEERWSFDQSGRLLIAITDRSSGSQAASVVLTYRRRPNPVALEHALQDSKDLTLDTRIPAANRQKYRSIRDAKDWENPYLVVLKNGVDVRAHGYRKTVPVSALRRVLVELPVSAWPYGAIVAVQEVDLRAVAGVDDAAIKANLSETLAALKALKVLADLWP